MRGSAPWGGAPAVPETGSETRPLRPCPLRSSSRRPWNAAACCRFSGASPLARHHSRHLPTSPSAQATAGPVLLGASQLSLRAEHACKPSPNKTLSQPARLHHSEFSLLTSHFSLPPSPFPPPAPVGRSASKALRPPHRPTNQPPSQSQCFTTRFRRFSTAPEKSASTVNALPGSGTGVGPR